MAPVGYVVSNLDWTVEVPDHVGAVLLATGAGAVRIDAPEEWEPEGEGFMVHATDPEASLSFRSITYVPEGGKVKIALCGTRFRTISPARLSKENSAHGLTICTAARCRPSLQDQSARWEPKPLLTLAALRLAP